MLISFGRSETERSASRTCTKWSLKSLELFDKELQRRWYMPELGRFTGVDPIAAEYAHVSTYNYAENEPVGHIDLWGLQKMEPLSADKNGIKAPSHILGSTIYNGRSYTMPSEAAKTKSISQGSDQPGLVKSFFNKIDNLLSKIPSGNSNNYNDTPNSTVGEGVEILSSDNLPGYGVLPLSTGSSKAIIETGDILIPSDGGGIVGDAANELNQFTRSMNNLGHALNNGKGAVDNLKNFPDKTSPGTDTINYNGQPYERGFRKTGKNTSQSYKKPIDNVK